MSKRTIDDVLEKMDVDIIFNALYQRVGFDKIRSMAEAKVPDLPVDLLAFVLSFVHLGDIKAVSCVCKKWNAAFKLPTFWRRQVFQKFKESPKRALCEKFDNFFFSNRETLQQQVEWLFFRSHYRLQDDVHSPEDLQITRWSNHGWAVTWYYPSMYIRHTFVGNLMLSGEANVVDMAPACPEYECLEYDAQFSLDTRKFSQERVRMTCKKMDGSMWKGQGTNGYMVHPHGSGEWTFPNGDVFRGEDVAFAGQPHGTGRDQYGKEVVYFAGKRIT